MQMLKSLDATDKKVAKKGVPINAFFAHSHQLLVAMCADVDETVRHKAVGLIRNWREKQQLENESDDEEDSESDDDGLSDVDEDLVMYTDDEEEEEEEEEEDGEEIVLDRTIRKVHVPKLKWQAHSYHTMIDWKKELESEPPFNSKLTDEQLIQSWRPHCRFPVAEQHPSCGKRHQGCNRSCHCSDWPSWERWLHKAEDALNTKKYYNVNI
jgi:hypothetical protein